MKNFFQQPSASELPARKPDFVHRLSDKVPKEKLFIRESATVPVQQIKEPKMAEPKMERSMSGLRELLFATLEDLRDGTIEPKQAAVTATVAQAILKSAEVQIDFHKAHKDGVIPGDFTTMRLTNGNNP